MINTTKSQKKSFDNFFFNIVKRMLFKRTKKFIQHTPTIKEKQSSIKKGFFLYKNSFNSKSIQLNFEF